MINEVKQMKDFISFSGQRTAEVMTQYRHYLKSSLQQMEMTTQTETPLVYQYHILDLKKEDMKRFTGIKVVDVMIENEHYSVSSWRQFLKLTFDVVSKMNRLDLLERDETAYKILFTKKTPFIKPYQLENGLQTETNMSAFSILKHIQLIAKCCQLSIAFNTDEQHVEK